MFIASECLLSSRSVRAKRINIAPRWGANHQYDPASINIWRLRRRLFVQSPSELLATEGHLKQVDA